MPNQMRGEAALGKHTLVFDFNALCLLEEHFNAKTSELLKMMSGEVGMRDLRGFVWAGLQAKHPDTSLQDAGNVIGAATVEATVEAITDALNQAFEQPKAKAQNPRKAA